RFEPADRLDGTSLLPLVAGDRIEWSDMVVGEYLAEGTVAPMVMIRRGRYKFVSCPGDPDQLYDVANDPLELVNLASDAGVADVVEALRGEVARRWDLDALHEDVVASQRRRRLLVRALSEGRPTSWDHRPSEDGS